MQVDKNYIINIRRELHRVPEIGFDLEKTQAIIRRELEAIGLPYTEEYGKSAIIATLNEGKGNKTIAIRADVDALPIQEETGLEFSSLHPGKMHACGHDCHCAMLLGTAKALKAMENEISCCVKFVFQAAEETGGGAKSICDDGFMDQVDNIIACHIDPTSPAGTVLLNKGCSKASSHGFIIDLYGKSCHVARPHHGVDAIAMANRVYTDIQIMRTREINPLERVVVGIGTFHGGTANNIVCDHVTMSGTIRCQDDAIDAYIYRRVEEIANTVAKDMGGSAKIESSKFYPALRNDHPTADGIIQAAEKVIDKENIIAGPESMGAEDFSYYMLFKPGAMFNLGVAPKDKPIVSLHNGKLIVDEDALVVAPKVFIQYILDQMDK